MDDIAAVQSIGISGTSTGTYNVDQTTTAVVMSQGGKTQTLSGLSAGQQTLSFDLFGVDMELDSTFNVTAASETFGTAKADPKVIEKAILDTFPLKPKQIISYLDLLRPIFKKTAAYGHFGRELPEFTWERTDKAEELKKLCGA